MKMVPIVALIREDDLEKLNPVVARQVERIERSEPMMAICADHGWSPDMLAWSMVFHQAAQRVV